LFFVAKNRKILQIPLTKKGKMGRIKPIRKFFRERRGMVMGRRILAVLAALLALLWAAVPAYAASPTVDSAYLTREPWQNVPVTEFRADGAMGYYQIYADTDNHCLYFAVSMQDQRVEPGAKVAVKIWAVEVLKHCRRRVGWVQEVWDDIVETMAHDATPGIEVRMRKNWREPRRP